MPTWPIAGGSLIAGFAVADVTGVRALGGLVLVAAAAWLAVRWRARAGTGRAVALRRALRRGVRRLARARRRAGHLGRGAHGGRAGRGRVVGAGRPNSDGSGNACDADGLTDAQRRRGPRVSVASEPRHRQWLRQAAPVDVDPGPNVYAASPSSAASRPRSSSVPT